MESSICILGGVLLQCFTPPNKEKKGSIHQLIHNSTVEENRDKKERGEKREGKRKSKEGGCRSRFKGGRSSRSRRRKKEGGRELNPQLARNSTQCLASVRKERGEGRRSARYLSVNPVRKKREGGGESKLLPKALFLTSTTAYPTDKKNKKKKRRKQKRKFLPKNHLFRQETSLFIKEEKKGEGNGEEGKR